MRGLVILEGPDACGKTTLAQAAVREFGAKYIHLTYIKGMKRMFDWQIRELLVAAKYLSDGRLVIIDRHWPSESIYADVYRGGSELGCLARVCDRIIGALGGVYVLCAPSSTADVIKWHRETSKTGREMYEPSKRFGQVAQKYIDLWARKRVRLSAASSYTDFLTVEGVKYLTDWAVYDRSTWRVDKLKKFFTSIVFPKLRDLRSSCVDFENFNCNMAGFPSTATCLVVGNSINSLGLGAHWPFSWRTTSSKTMAQLFSQLNLRERDFLWTNANSPVKPTLVNLLLSRDWSKIICLGEAAHDAVAKSEIDLGQAQVIKLAHPAFAKRFACKGELAKFVNSFSKATIDFQKTKKTKNKGKIKYATNIICSGVSEKI